MTLLEFLFIYSWNLDKRLKWLSFSSVFTLSSPRITESFVLYAKSCADRRPCYFMCGVKTGSWEVMGVLSWQSRNQLSLIVPSPAARRRILWRPHDYNGTFLFCFLTGMYQLDGLASKKIFHQDPDIVCNHPHCDTWRRTRFPQFEYHYGNHSLEKVTNIYMYMYISLTCSFVFNISLHLHQI